MHKYIFFRCVVFVSVSREGDAIGHDLGELLAVSLRRVRDLVVRVGRCPVGRVQPAITAPPEDVQANEGAVAQVAARRRADCVAIARPRI